MTENPWYSQLREAWKPSHVRLLLIAESAPDDGGDPGNRRFFYSERLSHDNLFRGVVAAMYGATRDDLAKRGKRPWLERLRDDGFYLIDLVPHPVNARQAHLRKRRAEYEGALHSIKKGAQVRWRKNMCANCNNARSQAFDLAYDVFEQFLVKHADAMMRWKRLDWSEVYGIAWQEGARDLARYFGKQIGCMLATQRLPVPQDLIGFLDGGPRWPSARFSLAINWRVGEAHKVMRRHGSADGMTTFVGLLDSIAYASEGRLTGADYCYHIGYLWAVGDWRETSDRTSWFEHQTITLPRVNDGWRDRLRWLPIRLQMESRHLRHRLGTDRIPT